VERYLEIITRLASAENPDDAEAALSLLQIDPQTEPWWPLAGVLAERLEEIFRLRKLAGSDELTGIANRRGFRMALDRAVARHNRQRCGVGVILLDLDNLKLLNDGHGHATGDAAIITTAHAIRDCLRATDMAARIGGDEFAVLVQDTDEASVSLVANRLRQHIERQVVAANPIKISVGYAALAHGAVDAATLILKADATLYADKRSRKGRASNEAA
jgi:diguanylate cyclase (GGDEF)-like protein